MKSTIYCAIVGYGGMGSYHAKLVEDSASLRVRGAYDILGSRLAAAEEDGYLAYASLEELLADSEVGVVIIATPNDSHKDIALRAFEAGKHVVCEKPATMSSSDFIEMTSAAEEAGRVLMVHQNRRWDEDYLIIKQMYDSHAIGPLFHIESRVHGANGIPGDWRHVEAHGGGMLLDWGVHLLDQLVFMIDSRIESLSARLSYVLGNEVDDGFEAYLQFENGVRAVVEVGTTNFITLPRWYVKGYEGTGIIEDWSMTGRIVRRNHDGSFSEPVPIKAGVGLTKTMAPPSEGATITDALPGGYVHACSFYDNLAGVIGGTAEPIVKNEEVLRVLGIIEAVFEAGRTGTTLKDFDRYYTSKQGGNIYV